MKHSSRTVLLCGTLIFLNALNFGCYQPVPEDKESEVDKLRRQSQRNSQRASALARDLATVNEAMYSAAKEADSIAAFEGFLTAHETIESDELPNLEEQRKEAYERIFSLVSRANCLDGYRYFVATFSDAQGIDEQMIREATDKIINVALKLASDEEDGNTLESYCEFLERFPCADEATRNKAIDKAANILNADAQVRLDAFTGELPSDLPQHEREAAKREKCEELAKEIAAVCVNALADDSDLAELKTQTRYIVYFAALKKGQLFNTTDAKLETVRHEHMLKKFDKVFKGHDEIRESLERLHSTMERGLTDIEVGRIELLERLREIQETQDLDIGKRVKDLITKGKFPFRWQNDKPVWENIRNLSGEAIEILLDIPT